MDYMAEFAQRLKIQREKLGLTQAQLAEKIGVTSQTISAYEQNNTTKKGKNPTLDKAVSLAQTLGVSLDFLCGLSTQTSEHDVENLADVVQCLSRIARKVPCLSSTKEVDLPPDEWESIPLSDYETVEVTSKTVAVFTMDNSTLANHFKNRNKISSLYESRVIDEHLYKTIIDGELAKLQTTVLPNESHRAVDFA